MERSTVYILVKTSDLEHVKDTDTALYNDIIGNSIEGGWASVTDYSATVREKNVNVSLITIDDVKWCTGFKDVAVVYDFLKTLDYWELVRIEETGEITYEADEQTNTAGDRNITADIDVDLSNLYPVKSELSSYTLPELVGQIADQCEDFLDKEEILLKINPDREEAISNGEDSNDLCQIYGEYYDRIGSTLRPSLQNLVDLNIRLTKKEAISLAGEVTCSMYELLRDSQAYRKADHRLVTDDPEFNLIALQNDIINTFENWGIVESAPKGEYVLISICERDMTSHHFESLYKAQMRMKFEFDSVCEKEEIGGNDCELEEGSLEAWANGRYNHDWYIICVA